MPPHEYRPWAESTIPATSDPRMVGLDLMLKPKSRCFQSAGLTAIALTSMRSSLGPGFGGVALLDGWAVALFMDDGREVLVTHVGAVIQVLVNV